MKLRKDLFTQGGGGGGGGSKKKRKEHRHWRSLRFSTEAGLLYDSFGLNVKSFYYFFDSN